MPTEAKPLFRAEALRPKVKAFTPPPAAAAARVKLTHWANLLESGQADPMKETELLAEFITDAFGHVLGYIGPAAGKPIYTLKREALIQMDGKFADAGLGRFATGRGAAQFIAVLEGKGPRDPLDRPFGSRRLSAVNQALHYAVNLPCDWYLVTNLKESRLYHKGHDQSTFERFQTAALAGNDAAFRRFVYLLAAERMVPELGRCHLDLLLAESQKIGLELTRDYYREYAALRRQTFEQLRAHNPDAAPLRLLSATQKILDRILFIAFCEDRGLLPGQSIAAAYQHADPYNPRPIWENFKGLFRAVDEGNPALDVARYNGGLFARDEFLEGLKVPDDVCKGFDKLAGYEYSPPSAADEENGDGAAKVIDVEILGHIFEQSISDLEGLHQEIAADPAAEPVKAGPSKRKREGAFYTPSFVTRYIVAQTLLPTLAERFETLRIRHEWDAPAPARKVLQDPRAYDVAQLKKAQKEALVNFWETWRENLATVRIVDPACGSGAFLIEAFEQLYDQYGQAGAHLAELRGPTLFDIDRQILEQNLYGVDLNAEAVAICRLSLWIKTAQRGKELTSLDHSIRVGNSIIADRAVHPEAFDWQTGFPEVFAAGGFDVVIGNPPYVRQEWIAPYKVYLQEHYRAYDGAADLYVYFYERGLNLLKPGGRLGFISSNSFTRAGYAEPLRKLFTTDARLEQVIDLGDTQVFADAKDVYPAIIILTKAQAEPTDQVCAFRFRRNDPTDNIRELVDGSAVRIAIGKLAPEGWQFDNAEVSALRRKLAEKGEPLGSLIKGEIYRGIITGLNEAFVVTTKRKNELIADGRSHEIIKPFIGGQHLHRWYAAESGNWLILLPSGITAARCGSTDSETARRWLKQTYPAIESHLAPFEAAAIKRTDQGQFWWELRACDYYDLFEKPKIIYPDIAKFPRFVLDNGGIYSNNTTYFLPSGDLFLLGVLNSEAMWFALSGISIPFGERAGEYRYRLFTQYIEKIPIPTPTNEIRAAVESAVSRLLKVAGQKYGGCRDFLDWLKVEFTIEKPSQKLQDVAAHDADALIAEVKKLRGKKLPLTVAGVKALREEHARTIAPLQALAAEARQLERTVADLVNQAYGLTPEEVALMWQTAPPRMPVEPPAGGVP